MPHTYHDSEGPKLATPTPVPTPTLAQPPKKATSDKTDPNWEKTYAFFFANCSTVVAVVDDLCFSPAQAVRKHPLMSAVIRATAPRAPEPERYYDHTAKVDQLIMNTFQGPVPDLMGVNAMMAFAAKIARGGGGGDAEHTPELVSRARCWFTLCCLDLQFSTARNLLKSPFRHAVDERICIYADGFTIAGDLKGQLNMAQIRSRPLLQEVSDLLTYINGLALQDIESAEDLTSDAARMKYIERALESACLIIQTQYNSTELRKFFHYTMDYMGTPAYYAIGFILKALPRIYPHVDCQKPLMRLHQAAQIFEEGGNLEATDQLRRDEARLTLLTQTEMGVDVDVMAMASETLFDVPSFLSEM
ncbi:hypothetical protein BJX70DRAFT_392914 [Aspergillus crustosus]